MLFSPGEDPPGVVGFLRMLPFFVPPNPLVMNKYLFLVIFLSSLKVTGQTTSDEGTAIMEPITRLFMGMNLGDSAMVHSAFTNKVSMATVSKDKSGIPQIRYESSLDGFLKAVGTPHDKAWNEPIWDVEVQIDGNMAQVWTKYAFYLGKTFSHCGVDAFQLFKAADGKWKIFNLADTRQKEGCQIPPSVSAMFK